MLIVMRETRRGSEDGFDMKRFAKDHVYDMAETLARDFIKKGWAKEATISDRLFDALRPASPLDQLRNLAKLEESYRVGEVLEHAID